MEPTPFDSANPDRMSVPPVNKDKQGKETDYTRFASFSLLFTAVAWQLLSGIVEENPLSQTKRDTLKEQVTRLERLQVLLEQLVNTDCSHNADFVLALALAYQQTYAFITDTPTTQTECLSSLLLQQLAQYPKGNERSLHNYLLHIKNPHWVPFPCMTLLQTLHLEAQGSPSKSHLRLWIKQLTRIVNSTSSR